MSHSGGSECSVRCFTERKAYCKDLHRWGKNLLYMIGLECVAKELTGRKSWPQISPFINDEESQHAEGLVDRDWKCEEVCPLCSGVRFRTMPEDTKSDAESLSTTKKSTVTSGDEAIANQRPTSGVPGESSANHVSQPKLNLDFIFDPPSANPAYNPSTLNPFFPAAFPHLFGMAGSTSYFSQLMKWSAAGSFNPSFYNCMPLFPGFFGSAFLDPASSTANGTPFPEDPEPLRPTDSKEPAVRNKVGQVKHELPADDEPLDLSNKKKSSQKSGRAKGRLEEQFQPATSAGVETFLSTNGVPSKKSHRSSNGAAVPSSNGAAKRNYTQADLEKAVKDIRSGRLGTRRASVVYGIPRSTLRNKIYKLEAAEELTGLSSTLQSKRSRRSGIAISSSPIDPDANAGQKSNSEAGALTESPSANSCSLEPLELTKSPDNVQNPDTCVIVQNQPVDTPEPVGALMESVTEMEMVKDSVVEQIAREQAGKLAQNPTVFSSMWNVYPDSWVATHPLLRSVVSDATAQAFGKIWQDLVQSSIGAVNDVGGIQEQHEPATSQTRTHESSPDESISPSSMKHHQKHIGGAWRKPRPKRGQYRRYEKHALDLAVQSVRLGEMSVHRAGSYYGVPHSTLEYKVKERNLMRAKKRDIKKSAENDSVEEKLAAGSGNSLNAVHEPSKSLNGSASCSKKREKRSRDISKEGHVDAGPKPVESLPSTTLLKNGAEQKNSKNHVSASHSVHQETLNVADADLPKISASSSECEILKSRLNAVSSFHASDMMRRLQQESLVAQHGSSLTQSGCATQ